LELALMGPPLVTLDEVSLKLETRKAVALLAYLAVDRRARPRECLATLLWPEYTQERAAANLRRALASLRSDLGEGWLRADRDTVELVGDVCTDLERFNRLLEEVGGHGHDSASGCTACRPRLEEAAGLYRGEFLEGFNLDDCPGFDQWQTFEREGVRQEVSRLLELLTEAYGAQGLLTEAVDTARRWLFLDELHEPAHRALMFLYTVSGRRSAALRQYERCRELLERELGQGPDDRTKALAERIRLRKLDGRPAAGAVKPAGPGKPASDATPQGAPGPATRPALPPWMVLTKLRRPQVRPTCVHRGRLAALLDRGTRLPLTLVSASAGFGKTTLLAEWAERCNRTVAWVSLDTGDNDPARFLSYLAAALTQIEPELGLESLRMLQTPQLPPLEFIVGSIINELDAARRDITLVLDDCHLVTGPEVRGCLAALIERLPPHVHLVIATRADPALPLALLRGRGGIAEIRIAQLRFSLEEAREFLRRAMGLELSEEEVGILERRTEGWAAGLQMAALSLQNRADHAEFIRTFGGSHRYIMDYLVEEVLRKQPDDLQQFLLTTAVLDRLCGGLCDAVTGSAGSQEILENLDAANLFLIPLDEERGWYRYHHLFADLLRLRQRQRSPAGAVRELHLRAGAWFEGSGHLEDAVRHYLSGWHYEETMRLLERSFKEMLTRGELRTLIGWIEQIPEELVRPRPGICVALGWSYAWAGRRADAERYLDHADRQLLAGRAGDPAATPETPEDRALLGNSAAIRAFILDMAGETARATELVRRADNLLPREDNLTRALIPYILGKAYRYAGKLGPAEEHGLQFLRVARATGLLWPVSGAMHEMVWVYRMQGRLRRADELLAEFDRLIQGFRHLGPVAKVIADQAELLREHGDLREAARVVEKAVDEVERWGLPSDMFFCYLTRTRILLSAGDPQGAARDVARNDDTARGRLVYASMLPLLEAERVRVFLGLGDLEHALSWVETYRPPQAAGPVNRDLELLALARVLAASSRPDESLQLLEQLIARAEQRGMAGRLLEMRILHAAVLSQAGREEEALASLTLALEQAGPEGYVRVFLDEGRPILRLLSRGLDKGLWTRKPAGDHARRLLETGAC
jgi:LuxR family maltose regulon positive regulatory protein